MFSRLLPFPATTPLTGEASRVGAGGDSREIEASVDALLAPLAGRTLPGAGLP